MATQIEIAKHLDLSDRSIRELMEKGVLPKVARGALDLDDCRVRYIRHLRAVAGNRVPGAAGDELTAERTRLAAEQADSYALKNAAMRLELLPRSEITRAVTAAFQHVRDRLGALPARLAGPLARMSDPAEVRVRLGDDIAAVLVELSEQKIISKVEGSVDA